ncbi:MAG: DUF4430 domain-containing protein [bacterium]
MKRISFLLFPLLALLLLGAGCFTTTVNVPSSTTNTNGSVQGAEVTAFSVPITIASGQADPIQLEVTIQNGASALDVLKKAAELEGLAVEIQSYDFGDLVEGIGGVKADNTHFWSFYVNGKLANVGAGSYRLQPGDSVEFRYEGN